MGVEMSSAFDTIYRQTILNVLSVAVCTEDETRLARLLLTNTILRINVNSQLSFRPRPELSRVMLHRGSCLMLSKLLP